MVVGPGRQDRCIWRLEDVPPRAQEEQQEEQEEEEEAARTTSAYFRQPHEPRSGAAGEEGGRMNARGGGDVDPVALGQAEEGLARARALEAARLEEAAVMQLAAGKKRSKCVDGCLLCCVWFELGGVDIEHEC